MREKGKTNDLPPISPIKEDREVIEQLEAEIIALQQKCKRLDELPMK